MKSIKQSICIAALGASMLFSCQTEQKSEFFADIKSNEFISKGFVGNGVQWSAYPHADGPTAEWGDLMTNAKWDTLFQRVDYMQPQLIRVVDQANWRYYKGLDKKGQPVLDFDNPEMNQLYKLMDYCQQNEIEVIFGEWGTPYHFHDLEEANAKKDRLDNAHDTRWIKMIGAYLDHMINTKGYTCIRYYNLVNEPNGDWASTLGDFEEWSKGVVALDKEIKERGLDKYVRVSGPGSVPQYTYPNKDYKGSDWVKMSIDQLDENIGAYEIHTYIGTEDARNGKAAESMYLPQDIPAVQKTGKKFFVGEIGIKDAWDSPHHKENLRMGTEDGYASNEDSQMAVFTYRYGVDMVDATIQLMNAGAQGMVAWDLDDAMHTKNDTGEKNKLKRWGFWNILGTELIDRPEDENIRPWFYPWSWICKYFPEGTDILKQETQLPQNVRLTAGVLDGKYTVMLVNNSAETQSIHVAIEGASTQEVKQLSYVEESYQLNTDMGRPQPKPAGFNLKKGSNVTLPAYSVVVLTTME
ncbi:cellulase family glycosylhydrolase [Sediminitomix flava]|uniref:Glycoside hydrolase family 5 domain-containing protein n=1 Tax=Sediminitomix flava TaxID=379075 RepID=A0A315ZCY6_SEDFL|nr:cellulase family glycosylhydrolase [Sediminitomix flava]PWJ43160.1 hypothetical protein BC781_102709 [Sediminitomix flava]